jgi:3-oxoacyl-[acyl-carrier protein] reductase
VAPGYVRTPWQIAAHGAEGAADLERKFAERAPLKAAAEPQDVADAIVWLIEGARRVTGEILYVDGGMHIASPR